MVLQRKTDDAGYVAGADPFGDVATVLLNCPFGKVDLATDLTGRFLLADESDDLDLTGGKAGIGDDQPGVFFFGKDPVNDVVTGLFTKIFLPFQNRMHGFREFSVIFVLDDIAVYAGAEHLQHRCGITAKRIGQDAGRRAAVLDLFYDGIPRKIGQDVVDDDELRLVLDRQRSPGGAGVGMPEISKFVTDQQAYPVDDHIVVVDHQKGEIGLLFFCHTKGINISME